MTDKVAAVFLPGLDLFKNKIVWDFSNVFVFYDVFLLFTFYFWEFSQIYLKISAKRALKICIA